MNNKFCSFTHFWLKVWLVIVAVSCATMPTANAGGWKLNRYIWDGKSHSEDLRITNAEGPEYGTVVTGFDSIPRKETSYSSPYNPLRSMVGVNYGVAGGPNSYTSSHQGIVGGSGEVNTSVSAEFVWQRNQIYFYDPATGQSSFVSDPNDNPPTYIYVRETFSASAGKSVPLINSGYSFLNPWNGEYYDIESRITALD